MDDDAHVLSMTVTWTETDLRGRKTGESSDVRRTKPNGLGLCMLERVLDQKMSVNDLHGHAQMDRYLYSRSDEQMESERAAVPSLHSKHI